MSLPFQLEALVNVDDVVDRLHIVQYGNFEQDTFESRFLKLDTNVSLMDVC